ncbi:MAG: alkaline phosphatase [Bacteroidales bacterium]|nr:alkaline phosphatase [Bacteroidales bacterium]
MKHSFKLTYALVTVMLLVAAAPSFGGNKAKYVFYLIGDGMGINEVYGAQLYNRATGLGPENLNFFQFPVRTFVSTFSASSLVTDSAAAATALATGVKTKNGAMGVNLDREPVSSVAEWAKAAGKGVGIATTVGINHATPGGFYAHTRSRTNYEDIAEQLAASKVDFAAGSTLLTESKRTGHDEPWLEQMIADAGVTILKGEDIRTAGSRSGRVLCLNGSSGDLAYAIDRTPEDTKLSDFVKAGIDYLSANYLKKGFFFMVEAGSIDHATHGDDGATAFQEINDLAATVDVVLDFYNAHPRETLVIVISDHETGALSLSSGAYAMKPELLAAQKGSENRINSEFRKFAAPAQQGNIPSWEEAKAFFASQLGLWDSIKVDEKNEEYLKEAYFNSFTKNEGNEVVTLYSVSAKVVSLAIDYSNRQAGYYWPHGSHSGAPVGLYVKGVGELEFLKCRDNTDVPKTIARVARY